MEVGVTAFRADLKKWLDLVRSGEEVVVTDRGIPIARMVPVQEAAGLEWLTRNGELSLPKGPKIKATGRRRVRAQGSVSELIVRQRREP